MWQEKDLVKYVEWCLDKFHRYQISRHWLEKQDFVSECLLKIYKTKNKVFMQENNPQTRAYIKLIVYTTVNNKYGDLLFIRKPLSIKGQPREILMNFFENNEVSIENEIDPLSCLEPQLTKNEITTLRNYSFDKRKQPKLSRDIISKIDINKLIKEMEN